MRALAAQVEPGIGGTSGGATWIVEYRDSDVFAYAVDRLRRHGLQKGLVTERSTLRLEIPQATVRRDGDDALAILQLERP